MTKSIKEKNRISQIKNHLLNGTDVTFDLLKVRLSFKNLYRYKKINKEKLYFGTSICNTILNRTWMKFYFYEIFNFNVKKLLINIARNLEIYELNLNIFFGIHNETASLHFILKDKQNNTIGNLYLSENDLKVFDCQISLKHHKPLTLKNVAPIIKFFENNQLNPYLSLMHGSCIEKYIANYKTKLSDKMINVINIHDYYLNNETTTILNISNYKKFKSKDTPRIFFHITDTIDCKIKHYVSDIFDPDFEFYFKNIDNYNKIDFLQTLEKLKIIDVDISNDEFSIIDIKEIEEFIKITQY